MEIKESSVSESPIAHRVLENPETYNESLIDEAIATLEIALEKLKSAKTESSSESSLKDRVWTSIVHVAKESSLLAGALTISTFALGILFLKPTTLVLATAIGAALGSITGLIKGAVELSMGCEEKRQLLR